MKIVEAPLAVLRLQYRIARFPLELIEQRVVSRMDSEAPARLLYERSLGMLDATVGNALGDKELAESGTALAKRSDALGRAARLDAAAEKAQQQSRADLKAKSNKAVKEQQDARSAAQGKIDDARASANEQKREASVASAQRTTAAKRQADVVAAQRTKAAEAAKREEHAKIRADEQAAAKAAASKLEDAAEERAEADAKRAQADQIEDLADAEKRKRQTSPQGG
ncbi:IF2 family translation initiation factor [Mycobacterium barrassiae]|uniref:IF2 family translation initiation factor n=1 Tax=Mycobacterium barrassiae TaxID=319709 RepID=UPI0022658CA1|nr:IF2 family translation initiation factor [Mycobacterium barrassiae]MCV7302318.1 IF2 family translation initiation factor [Mycobacterium barrassiae]